MRYGRAWLPSAGLRRDAHPGWAKSQLFPPRAVTPCLKVVTLEERK